MMIVSRILIITFVSTTLASLFTSAADDSSNDNTLQMSTVPTDDDIANLPNSLSGSSDLADTSVVSSISSNLVGSTSNQITPDTDFQDVSTPQTIPDTNLQDVSEDTRVPLDNPDLEPGKVQTPESNIRPSDFNNPGGLDGSDKSQKIALDSGGDPVPVFAPFIGNALQWLDEQQNWWGFSEGAPGCAKGYFSFCCLAGRPKKWSENYRLDDHRNTRRKCKKFKDTDFCEPKNQFCCFCTDPTKRGWGYLCYNPNDGDSKPPLPVGQQGGVVNNGGRNKNPWTCDVWWLYNTYGIMQPSRVQGQPQPGRQPGRQGATQLDDDDNAQDGQP